MLHLKSDNIDAAVRTVKHYAQKLNIGQRSTPRDESDLTADQDMPLQGESEPVEEQGEKKAVRPLLFRDTVSSCRDQLNVQMLQAGELHH